MAEAPQIQLRSWQWNYRILVLLHGGYLHLSVFFLGKLEGSQLEYCECPLQKMSIDIVS